MRKRHLITGALPYINGFKHLGNLVGSMLPADVYARHPRGNCLDVPLICATDEHGWFNTTKGRPLSGLRSAERGRFGVRSRLR